MMKTTIQTFSGREGPDGQPELLEEREIVFGPAEVAAIKASALAATDAGMARVVEELVEALLRNETIRGDDLSDAARARIAERKALRAQT
jgi:hypothetical protein